MSHPYQYGRANQSSQNNQAGQSGSNNPYNPYAFGRANQSSQNNQAGQSGRNNPYAYGRANQSSQNNQAGQSGSNNPYATSHGAVAPRAGHLSDNSFRSSTLTGASNYQPGGIIRTIEHEDYRIIPPSPLTGPVSQVALPRGFFPPSFERPASQEPPAPRYFSPSFTRLASQEPLVPRSSPRSFTRSASQESLAFSDSGSHSSSYGRESTPRASTHRAAELPRTVSIEGYLYHRGDSYPRDNMLRPPGEHMGGLPSFGQYQDRFSRHENDFSHVFASREAQSRHDSATRDIRSISHGSRHESMAIEDNQSIVHGSRQQSVAMGDQISEDDQSIIYGSRQQSMTVGDQTWETPSITQATSHGSASTSVQRPQARSSRTAQKPKRKPAMLRGLEPYNKSPEPNSESLSHTNQHVAPTKRKRNSKQPRKVKNVNQNPDPSSDSEPIAVRRRTTRLSQPASVKRERLLRELKAHNQSPESESKPELGIDVLNEAKNAPMTRRARRDTENFIQDKTPSPKKDLNVKHLMLAQFSGKPKGTKTFYPEKDGNLGRSSHKRKQGSRKEVNVGDDEDDDEEEYWAKDGKSAGQSHPQPMSSRPTMPGPVGSSGEKSQRKGKGKVVESPRSVWDGQKGKINELINSPRYAPHPSQRGITAELPEAFQGDLRVDDGLHVFSPTTDAFLDFGRFLKAVEEVAGRKMGVVKVVIPSGCLSQVPTPVGGTFPKPTAMKTTKAIMCLNKDAAKEPSEIYDILMTDGLIGLEANELVQKILRDRDNITKKDLISAEAIGQNDIWREQQAVERYTEGRMIRRSMLRDRAVVLALNVPATATMRAALRCKNPGIDSLIGNRFASSRSNQAGINEAVFHIARGRGILSPLQMNKYAAYSLNYHHSGTSRIVTVTRPEHHEKLEHLMHTTRDSGNLFVQAKPPACSQFVAHEPMYVPHATLESHGINYTEVVQHPGEMVITFPYAYHQAYTSGPNITEEMGYASDRCMVFHREGLYHVCHSECAAKEPDDFNLEDVVASTMVSTRKARR